MKLTLDGVKKCNEFFFTIVALFSKFDGFHLFFNSTRSKIVERVCCSSLGCQLLLAVSLKEYWRRVVFDEELLIRRISRSFFLDNWLYNELNNKYRLWFFLNIMFPRETFQILSVLTNRLSLDQLLMSSDNCKALFLDWIVKK